MCYAYFYIFCNKLLEILMWIFCKTLKHSKWCFLNRIPLKLKYFSDFYEFYIFIHKNHSKVSYSKTFF